MTPDEIKAAALVAEEQIVEQSKRIEFYVTEYSVELLAHKMVNEDFEIPPYQRDDTWEPARKSRFIESLLMGLPIPFLFFWEKPETGRLEIVDGSQRLRTIRQFIHEDLVLGELDELTALQGLRFRDLPEPRQRKIKNRSIRGIVLNEHADEEARFDLFDRINTSSKIANNAEVRRGALIGPFLNLVIDLANDKLFGRLAPVPPAQMKLREREELVTRFFAYSDGFASPGGLDGYNDRPSQFLFKYAKKMNARFEEQPDEIDSYKQRFSSTMAFVERVFPFGFRRAVKGRATPRARFEAIAIGSFMALNEKPGLRDAAIDVSGWHMAKEFKDITGSDGANAISRLRRRTEFVRNKLLEA